VLNEAFVETVEDPEFKEFLENQGIAPVEYSTSELSEIMAEDHEMYSELMELLDL